MKLKNKKTGEIGYFCFANWDSPVLIIMDKNGVQLAKYNSLAELNSEWEDMPEEDYVEPKEYYAIDLQGDIIRWARHSWDEKTTNKIKEIGNYFETKEEAEKAVEKLKAWIRLKDKGFKSFSSNICGDDFVVRFKLTNHADYSQSMDDFDCVFDFGGKE